MFLKVTTAASTSQLTTVARVRAEFPAITTGVADDTLLGRWIDRASAMAVEYCGRKFAQEAVQERDWNFCKDVILLARTPATAITVTLDGTELVEDTDFIHDAATGALYRLSDGQPTAWSGSTLVIDYDGGYVTPDDASPTLPGDVEYAVQLWVASFVASQSSATSSTGSGGLKREVIEGVGTREYFQETTSSGSAETSVSADRPSPESLLAPYRRIVL